jgi:SAM-dependent methyltransferase
LKRTALQRLAGRVSASFLLRKGKRLWEANSKKWDLPLTMRDKLLAGGYIILRDYADGIFPPRFEDQALEYQKNIDYNSSLPGYSFAKAQKAQGMKPFWGAAPLRKYLREFERLVAILEDHGLRPGARLLELGCGCGWMAEFLALGGYSVLGTTIAPDDVALGNQKVAALRAKEAGGAAFQLEFLAWPMESVDEIPKACNSFDGAFVYAALHHAFDWRKALGAAAKTLKPGGWLLLADEPNWFHTFKSYRVARLSNTHEIGFSRKELVQALKAAGFSTVCVLVPRINDRVTPFWITARKGDQPVEALR